MVDVKINRLRLVVGEEVFYLPKHYRFSNDDVVKKSAEKGATNFLCMLIYFHYVYE